MIDLGLLTPLNILKVIVVVISAYIVSRVLEILIMRSVKGNKKMKNRLLPLKRIMSIIIYFVGLVIILSVFNIDITAAAAGLGIGAIVIGFGLQDIISNWISGVIIISEGIYRIGDVIRIGNITGTVTDITLRSTRLKTYDRNEVIIPNTNMITEKIINLTAGRSLMISSISFTIDYTCNEGKAKKIIEKILRKNENVVVDTKKRREIRFIVRSNGWETQIETLFWINKPKEETFIKSDIAEAVETEFTKNKLIPPLPSTMRKNYMKK